MFRARAKLANLYCIVDPTWAEARQKPQTLLVGGGAAVFSYGQE